MVRSFEELGMDPETNSAGVVLPPPTHEQVEQVERVIGHRLPKLYVDFLRFSNGGSPEAFLYDMPMESGGGTESVADFYCVAPDVGVANDILQTLRYLSERLPDGVLPIARDAGDNTVCLDFRSEGEPHVSLWWHESGNMVAVSPTFGHFVGLLRCPTEEEMS